MRLRLISSWSVSGGSSGRSDRFPILSFHHVEFWTGDATTAASRFSFSLGLPLTARSDLSTGNSAHCSLLLRSPSPLSSLPLTLTPPLTPPPPSPHSTLPRPTASSPATSASPSAPSPSPSPMRPPPLTSLSPMEQSLLLPRPTSASASTSLRSPSTATSSSASSPDITPPSNSSLGLTMLRSLTSTRSLYHAVGNVAELAPVVSYMKRFLGFHEFAEFTAEDVGTAEIGLNSVVLANNEESVLLAVNETVHGTKRRSQIQTSLDHNGGPGVHHLDLRSHDVIWTLKKMRAVSGLGGFEFMPAPPPNYYEGVKKRAEDVLSDEQIRECQQLGLLVDRDDQGLVLQIFTKRIGDRSTIFLEFIQRIGCMVKDKQGKVYQKGGCGGFDKGNFSELFKCIEEYEKTLEAKQPAAAISSS